MRVLKKAVKIPLIALFWLGVWILAAHKINKPLLFPYPKDVLARLWELLQTEEFYQITLTSLENVFSGILTAVFLGIALAVITCRISPLRDLLLPVMTVIKATPVASFIVLAMILLGSARIPTFITILIVLPVIWTNLDEGFSKIDPKLSEVTRVYKMPLLRRWRVLILPSLKPYFVSACRASIGLAWKAGVAAEIIAMPKNTIGTMIGEAKLYIESATMFAWTLTVILLSLAIEFLFTALLGRLVRSDEQKEVA